MSSGNRWSVAFKIFYVYLFNVISYLFHIPVFEGELILFLKFPNYETLKQNITRIKSNFRYGETFIDNVNSILENCLESSQQEFSGIHTHEDPVIRHLGKADDRNSYLMFRTNQFFSLSSSCKILKAMNMRDS